MSYLKRLSSVAGSSRLEVKVKVNSHQPHVVNDRSQPASLLFCLFYSITQIRQTMNNMSTRNIHPVHHQT